MNSNISNVKIILFFCIICLSISKTEAQKGFYAKFSLGPGYTTEYATLNGSGVSYATKNHALGWGITDNLGIQIGDFGSLFKQKVGKYNYINLDVYGLGFSYRTPSDFKISSMFGYGTVSLAEKWTAATGKKDGSGFGINMSIEKEWFVGKRWGLRVGPQAFRFTTKKKVYKFYNVSLNGTVVFYLTPHKKNNNT